MTATTEITLVLIPMSLYLYLLGILHGGKHPRLVSGVGDLAGLIFSLSGLVAFGPVGHVVVSAVFGPDATEVAWLTWLATLVLMAGLIARTGRNRLVIYHVEPEQIRAVTRARLLELDGAYLPTLQGFENPASRTSVLLRIYPRMQTATIEATGEAPAGVMKRLRPHLRQALRAIDEPVSSLSTAFFTVSGMLMAGPVVGYLVLDPQGRRLVRAVGRWVGWG